MKIIIFRCDRIGDFLLSSILMNNIKNMNKDIKITVVCSDQNKDYVNKSFLVDDVMIIPKSIIKRISFFFHIMGLKYDKSIVLDGKKWSIFSSILLNCNDKILLTNKINYKKFFSSFFNKIIYSKENTKKIDELSVIASYLNFNFNLKFSKYKNIIKNIDNNILKLIEKTKNFNIFHFDEKWIFNSYIKSYKNIEPNKSELFEFIYLLTIKKKQDLFLTTGVTDNKLIIFLKSKFKKIDTNIYQYRIKNCSIFLIENLNIHNLEYLISKSGYVITCHGAPSHLANMYNKNLIDIIDSSEQNLFSNWTHHFTNYKSLNREPFLKLSDKIIRIFGKYYVH